MLIKVDAGTTRQLGLGHWMRQVVEQLDRASDNFDPDPVHDLRVAIRRCRSIAQGLQDIDSDRTWKKMRSLGKQVFAPLGDLRDVQVMMDWARRLGTPDDPITPRLLALLEAREQSLKQIAAAALQEFDRNRWCSWIGFLSRRAQRVPLGSAVFEYLALERWENAHRLHTRATRTAGKVALHDLRIGIKKLRYMVETFLPVHEREWGNDLKKLQDLLGDIHDLDVFVDLAANAGAFDDPDVHSLWLERIRQERERRFQEYKRKACGQDSLWKLWRDGLPSGHRLDRAALAKFSWWASSFADGVGDSRKVASLALQLHDGMVRKRVLDCPHQNARNLLHAAALTHGVGRGTRKKAYHKKSGHLVARLTPPIGWPADDIKVAAEVVRYHRGALPQPGKNGFSDLSAAEQNTLLQLAGILRLASALHKYSAGQITRVAVRKTAETVVIYVQGYDEAARSAEKIAAARHLLEVSCHRPVLVRSWASSVS